MKTARIPERAEVAVRVGEVGNASPGIGFDLDRHALMPGFRRRRFHIFGIKAEFGRVLFDGLGFFTIRAGSGSPPYISESLGNSNYPATLPGSAGRVALHAVRGRSA